MTLTLNPHTEERLRALAAMRNLSVEEVIEQWIGSGEAEKPGHAGHTLYELAAPLRGLFTDEEIDSLFARDRSPSRQVDLE